MNNQQKTAGADLEHVTATEVRAAGAAGASVTEVPTEPAPPHDARVDDHAARIAALEGQVTGLQEVPATTQTATTLDEHRSRIEALEDRFRRELAFLHRALGSLKDQHGVPVTFDK
jgi:hypothetical protein